MATNKTDFKKKPRSGVGVVGVVGFLLYQVAYPVEVAADALGHRLELFVAHMSLLSFTPCHVSNLLMTPSTFSRKSSSAASNPSFAGIGGEFHPRVHTVHDVHGVH